MEILTPLYKDETPAVLLQWIIQYDSQFHIGSSYCSLRNISCCPALVILPGITLLVHISDVQQSLLVP